MSKKKQLKTLGDNETTEIRLHFAIFCHFDRHRCLSCLVQRNWWACVGKSDPHGDATRHAGWSLVRSCIPCAVNHFVSTKICGEKNTNENCRALTKIPNSGASWLEHHRIQKRFYCWCTEDIVLDQLCLILIIFFTTHFYLARIFSFITNGTETTSCRLGLFFYKVNLQMLRFFNTRLFIFPCLHVQHTL